MTTVLGINGSHRGPSNSEALLDYTLDHFKSEKDCSVSKVNLLDYNIEFCDACETCSGASECHLQDDMHKLYPKLLAADIIIVASPAYFALPSARLKTMMDRTNSFFYTRALRGKIGGIITNGAGTFGGIEVAAQGIGQWMRGHEMTIAPFYACFNNSVQHTVSLYSLPLPSDFTDTLDKLYDSVTTCSS